MLQIDSRPLCKQENIVVQVSSLDPVFPCAADDGMYLSGKQGKQIIQINAVWRCSFVLPFRNADEILLSRNFSFFRQ